MAGAQRHPLVLFWTYTLLRVAIFAALFGVLWLCGLRGLLGAAVALSLSIPLSFVLLSRQRNAMAGELHDRMMQRQQRSEKLSEELSGDEEPEH